MRYALCAVRLAPLMLLVALVAPACSNPAATCNGAGTVQGTWSYRGSRDTPARGNITGSLRIEMGNCIDLQGAMDIVEVLPDGASRRMAGPISGTLIDSGLVRFEALFSTGSREHFASIRGDSVVGTWIEVEGAESGSGSFVGRRQDEQ